MSDFRLQPLGRCCLLRSGAEGGLGSPRPCCFPVCSRLPPTGDRGFVTLSFAGSVPLGVTELKCPHFLLCFFFEMGETVVASWAHFTDRATEATAAGGKLSQGRSLSEPCVFKLLF